MSIHSPVQSYARSNQKRLRNATITVATSVVDSNDVQKGYQLWREEIEKVRLKQV